MENTTKAETSGTFIFSKDAESQKSDVREDEREVIEDKDFKRLSSSYTIMTYNMGVDNKKTKSVTGRGEKVPVRRREIIISAIKDSDHASIIFCQEVPKDFETEVVAKCGNYASSGTKEKNGEAAVMWSTTDFKGKTVDITDPSIKEIVDKLEGHPRVKVGEIIRTKTAMVKLTSETVKAPFLAVSWHGPYTTPKDTKREDWERIKSKLLRNDLLFFLREVCKKENLSSYIVGGDFNLNTREVTVDQTQCGRVTISRYKLCFRDEKRLAKTVESHRKNRGQIGFIPYKDTFIVSVTVPSDKRLKAVERKNDLLAVDITVPMVTPFEPTNESSENSLLDHVPVLGVFKLAWPNKKHFKQDRGKLEQHLIYDGWPTLVCIQQSCDYAKKSILGFLKIHFRIPFYFTPSSRPVLGSENIGIYGKDILVTEKRPNRN